MQETSITKMLEHLDAEEGVEASHDTFRKRVSAVGAPIEDVHSRNRRGPAPRSEDTSEAIPEAPLKVEVPEVDFVNHPRHYTSHPSGIECITIIEWMNFNVGNAIKYLWRAGEKGFEIQDLEKAEWYVKREIERLKKLRDKKEKVV